MAGSASVRDVVDPWYLKDRADMGPEVQRVVDSLKGSASGRRSRYVRNVELYERRPMSGYSAHTYEGGDGLDDDMDFDRDRMGLLRSAVETAVSQVYAPQKPKPQFQTSGADWATRRRAYKLDRICEGVINQRQDRWINVWAFMVDAGVECALQGTACVWVQADKARGRIAHTLVPSVDVFVDPAEGRNPQNLFFRRPVPQDEALRLWPGQRSAVSSARDYEWYGGRGQSAPRAVKVVEAVYAYRLPFGKGEPGRWCCVVNGTVVDSGKWTAPMFPLVFLQWAPHRDGFWASGLGAEGARMARECGELDLRLWYRELIASGQTVYYPVGSVNKDDLVTNEARKAVPYDPAFGVPQEQVSTPFNPMELDYLNQKVRSFWDALGISQVSAAARREQGVTSGVGIRTLNDTKAGRQLLKAQRYEQAFVDLSHQYVWRLRELAEDDKGFEVRWSGKSIIRSIRWSDADVEDDMFSVSVAPASALPSDPAGRQEMVQDLLKANMISQETAKSLMGWPDLDAEMNVANAEYEWVDSLIERYLDADPEGWSAEDYQAPTSFIANKMQAVRRFAAAWFRARTDMATLPPAERAKADWNLGLLERFIKELDQMMAPPPTPTDQTAPVAAQAPAAGQAAA